MTKKKMRIFGGKLPFQITNQHLNNSLTVKNEM